ncbi:hypothetical protein DPMN_160924 [Dreissena polymorpha]|uniref:Uncharacterized protein n=1 Tax=Dreissena polymorpha TaxID=45954 RepID=A0A9D4EPF8_DREPO|nr:hypothetical protein DPMN_160924 [Dreissena polymorpha]
MPVCTKPCHVLTDVVEAEIESFCIQMLQHAQVTTLQPQDTVCNKRMTPNVFKCPTKTICNTNRRGCKFHNSVALSNKRCPTNGMWDSLCKSIIDNHRFKRTFLDKYGRNPMVHNRVVDS